MQVWYAEIAILSLCLAWLPVLTQAGVVNAVSGVASHDTSLVVSGGVDCRRRWRNVYDKKPQRYAKDNRTAHLTARSDKSVAYITNNKRLYSTFCTVEANYWQTRSIAQLVCDSRATCTSTSHVIGFPISQVTCWEDRLPWPILWHVGHQTLLNPCCAFWLTGEDRVLFEVGEESRRWGSNKAESRERVRRSCRSRWLFCMNMYLYFYVCSHLHMVMSIVFTYF